MKELNRKIAYFYYMQAQRIQTAQNESTETHVRELVQGYYYALLDTGSDTKVAFELQMEFFKVVKSESMDYSKFLELASYYYNN